VYIWFPAYIWVVYAARVHVHAAYTSSGYFRGYVIYGPTERWTMSGGQKEGWLWDKQALPGWEYVELLGGEGDDDAF